MLQTILLMGAALISFLAYLAGILIAIQKRGKSRKASNYILAGLGILMFSFLFRTIGMATFATAHVAVVMQLFDSAIFAVAIGLFVAAAFVDRERNTSSIEEFLPGNQGGSQLNDNPYAASHTNN